MPLLCVLEELSHIWVHDWLNITVNDSIAWKFFSCIGPYSSVIVYIELGYIILKTQDLARAIIGLWAFDNPEHLTWSHVAIMISNFLRWGFGRFKTCMNQLHKSKSASVEVGHNFEFEWHWLTTTPKQGAAMSYAFSSSGRKVIPKVSFSMTRDTSQWWPFKLLSIRLWTCFYSCTWDELHFDSRLNA